MATQTQNYKLHKFELKDAPADITAINASMDIIDTQLKALADGKFDKTGGTISGNLVVNGSTTLKKLTASELDLNGNADVSGTLKVAGATTLTGALAANGGVTTTSLKATETSTLAAVNATNISASGTLNVTGTTTLTGKLTANGGLTTKALTATSLDLNGNGDVSGSLTVHGDLNAPGSLNVSDITATGSTTLVNLNAANITATGTLKVNGATTLTGLLAANGGVTTKKVTATELDLNGNADVSGTLTVHGATTLEAVQAKGNLTVGGLLNVTGKSTFQGGIELPYGANLLMWGNQTNPYKIVRVIKADGEAGDYAIFAGANQSTILCSGEMGSGAFDADLLSLAGTSESVHLVSDHAIYFHTNLNSGVSQVKTSYINTAGSLYLAGGIVSGGSITASGDVRITGSYRMTATNEDGTEKTCAAIQAYGKDANGGCFLVRGMDGLMILGSGESGPAVFDTIQSYGWDYGSEQLALASDQEISFFTNCNLWENHNRFTLTQNGLYKRLDGVTKGDSISAKYLQIALCDEAGLGGENRYGCFEINTRDGRNSVYIMANSPNAGVADFASLRVWMDPDGTQGSYAPTPVTGSNDNSIATTAFVMAAAGTMTLKATRTSAGSFTVTGLKVNQLVMVQCELRNDTWDGGDYSRIASDNTTSPSSLQTGASTGGYSLFMVALAETVTFTVTNNGISSATWKVYVL